jgi:DnaJ like chaperone protein
MSKYGKWIGGGLGWALGGPIGAIIGFMFGSMFDNISSETYAWQPPIEPGETQDNRRNYSERDFKTHRNYTTATQTGDFTVSLLVLAAAVMKADNRILKSELDFVKRFLRSQFSEEMTRQSLLMLREILKKDYDLLEVSKQVARFMDYPSKLQLLHFLFGISQADSNVIASEVKTIQSIASLLGISSGDFDSIKAMFIKDNFHNYRILEITPDASNDEVKKAYRKMAVKFHPDKVSHLGAEIQESAKNKFQELNAAYEAIRKERGMK